jgi:hypothetical protein
MSGSSFGNFARVGAAAGLTLAMALGFGSAVVARPASEAVQASEIQPAYEQVDSFSMLARPHSWQAVDEDTVIVWATAFRPYLVELAFPSHELRFAHVIGVTSMGSRVYAKFDAVKVDGFRYPIDTIYKMTREEARNLATQS